MSAHRKLFPAVAAATTALIPAAEAQNPAVTATEDLRQRKNLERTLEKSRENAGGITTEVSAELFAGEQDDMGPLEVLRSKRRKKWASIDFDSQFFYTSNSALTEDPDDTTMLVHTASLTLGPDMIDTRWGELVPRAGYRHQFFNYALLGSQAAPGVTDFDSQAFFGYASLTRPNKLQFLFSFEYQRLLNRTPDASNNTFKEFYRDFIPRLSVTKTYNRSETRYFTLNYQVAYHLSETPGDPVNINVQDRVEQVFTASYTHAFNPKWVAQPFYRAIHNHYTDQNDRDDLTHSIGTMLLYTINDHFSLRSFFAYDIRETDLPTIPDYDKIDVGAALHFNYRF